MTLPATQPLLNIYDVMPAAFREALDDPYVTDFAVRDDGHGFVTCKGEHIDIGPVADYVPLMLSLAPSPETGKLINDENPMLDCRLPRGERLTGMRPEIAGHWTVAIRRHFLKRLTWDDLIEFGTITKETAELIEQLLRAGKSGVIAGGMGSGKTTMLNVMLGSPAFDKVVTVKIEATNEIMGPRICTTYEIGDLCSFAQAREGALRQNAKVFIVGEARSGTEMSEVMSAYETGHPSFTTLHADSVSAIPGRIAGMFRQIGDKRSEQEIHESVVEHIDFCVHMAELENGKKIVTDVAGLAMSGGRATRREVAF